MGIKAKYNKKDLFAEFQNSYDGSVKFLTKTIFDLGKKAVDIAFTDGNYINRTGVLRSSIGCGISFGGLIIGTYGFYPVPEEGTKGISLGKTLLEDKLKSNVKRDEIKLVIVAGAYYASFVEDTSNYVVLDSGLKFIQDNLDLLLSELNFYQNE